MSPPLIPLVYLVYREALSSVIASQVLTPLEEHGEVASVTLGMLTPIGQLIRSQCRPALRKIDERCRKAGIQVGWIPSPPSRTPWLWSDSFLLRQWISKRFSRDQTFIVRCRNAQMTGIALDALHGFDAARVIYDCRGAEITETAQCLGISDHSEATWSPADRKTMVQAAQRERRAVVEASGVTCVSFAMASRLRAKYADQPSEKFCIVPCCPDVDAFTLATQERDLSRRAHGLTDKFVVSYLGSLAWYQLPEASFRIFRIIKSIQPQAHFLAITTEPVKMQQLADQAGILADDRTIQSVPPDEVPRLLVASDLGLMLRDDSETNRVASPIKFGEYMAAGVPVVISQGLGDYSAAVRKLGLGAEVDLAGDDSSIEASLQEILKPSTQSSDAARHRCREFAATELAWSSVTPRLASWYASLHPPRLQSTNHAFASRKET